MAENGVINQSLTSGSLDTNYQVEQLIFWGMGRAAVAALAPKFGTVALCANAGHMVAKMARIHDVDLRQSAVLGLVGGLTSTLATALISLLIPSKIVRVPVAVGVTYAIGKVANVWIEDGCPSDIDRYKPMLMQWLKDGKSMAAEVARDAANTIGQGDFWDGLDNAVGLAAEALNAKYAARVEPVKEKWNTETKYAVHDAAAEAVAKASQAVQNKVDIAKEAMKDQLGVASASVDLAKSVGELAKIQAQEKVDSVKHKVTGVKEAAQGHVETVKNTVSGITNKF